MTKQGVTETLNNLQSMLQPTSQTRDTMRKNVDGFWSNQNKILGSMEEFANGWFERRHAGTQAALTAAQRICNTKTPVNTMQEYQTWAIGSLERIIADSLAFQKHLMTVAGLFAKPPAPPEKESVPEATVTRALAASVLTQRPDKKSPKK